MGGNNCLLNEKTDQPRSAGTEKALGEPYEKKKCTSNYCVGN